MSCSAALSTDQRNTLQAPSRRPFMRCLRLATFPAAVAVVRPPKAYFQLVVNHGWLGLVTHKVQREVSALPTPLPSRSGFAWHDDII
jgi:hypothetical protein